MNATELEAALLARPLPDILPSDQGWVMPAYDGLSIANLPATVVRLLGAELPGTLPPLPEELWSTWRPGLRRVVLVVLDALGWRGLQRMQAAGQAEVFGRLAAGRSSCLVPLTSIFPSTTSAALVSLRAGHAPASHGWLAYEMYLREVGIAANAIQLRPVAGGPGDQLVAWGLDMNRAIPQPALLEVLSAAGITTRVLISAYLGDSAFSQMLYRGAGEMRRHWEASDFWVQLRGILAQTRGRPAYITAYWSGLDTIGHMYGHDTEVWEAEFYSVTSLLGREFLHRLPEEDREGTLLLITADHGQTRVLPDRALTADEDRELAAHLLVPVMGESRAAFIYPRPGHTAVLRHYLEEVFGRHFVVAGSAEAVGAGLMGMPISEETWARAGELLVLPLEGYGLQRTRPRSPLVSRHGGLTPEEMLVPLLGARLDEVD
jgi:hypothetical protein